MKKSYLIFLMACAFATSGVAVAQETSEPVAKVGQKQAEATETVTGVVLNDATGAPIPGAQLRVVDARHSAMTDDEGKFSIKVPVDAKGQALVEIAVTAPGHSSTIVTLRDRRSLDIRLMEEGYITKSNRLIYTPLGMKEESHIPYAVGVYAEDNSISVKGTPEAALNGNIAGLQTQFRSGTDWSGANLLLRGINSIYANNKPLIILDGLVIENQEFGTSMIEGQISTPFGCIDIKDIDQIVVMKDATTIYGAKGANGAILIRTKHTTDQATHIDVTALTGMNMQPKKIPMLGALDSKRLLTDIAQTSGLDSKQLNQLSWINSTKPQQQPDGSYKYGQYWKYNQDTDWQDEIFQTGFKQQYSLNVTGGDDVAIYGVSVGFQNKEGVVKGSDFQRFNARVNSDIKFTDKIRLFTNMNFVYGSKNLSNEGSASNLNPIYTALVKAPFTTLRSVDEVNQASTAWENVDALGAANPAAVVNDMVAENSFYRFMGSYNLEIDLPKGFQLQENFGLDFNKEREVIFHPTVGIPYPSLSTSEVTNEQIHRVERLFNILSETRLNYKKTLDQHKFDATLGFRYFHATAEDDFGKGYNSASNAYQTIESGDATLHQIGGALGNWNWMSVYANLDYSWKGRYFADLTVAADASSRFGEDIAAFQVYPGVNAGWIVTGENWMKNQNWLSLLKVRAGWNMSGNDDISNYSNKLYYTSTRFLTGNGLIIGSLKNNDIKPERLQKMNVGIDASFLHNRIGLSLDVYKTKISDMMTFAAVQSFTGVNTFISNGGKMENAGLEASVNGRLVNKRNFSWDLALNVAHNHNKVTRLDDGAFENVVGDGSVVTMVGSSAGVFYGYKTDGVYATTAEANASGLSTMVGAVAEKFQAGDVKFVDQNGDHIIDVADRVMIGDPNPDVYGGISSTMKSHGFTLSADFTFCLGNDIYNYTRSQLESMSNYSNQTKNTLLRWRTEGDVTKYPRASFGDSHKNNRFSDRWIEDGSFFKLKSLSLAYDFNLKSEFITGLTVYGTCENVFTLTNYSGYDPEIATSSSNNILYQGVDAFTTPTTRTFFVGLKIGL